MYLNHPTNGTDVPNTAASLSHAAADAAREAGAVASHEAARFGDMARHWFQRNAKSALDVAGTVKHEAVEFSDRTERYVRDEPLRSMVVVAVAGVLLGGLAMWLGRRTER